jgi:hypothetical protein
MHELGICIFLEPRNARKARKYEQGTLNFLV